MSEASCALPYPTARGVVWTAVVALALAILPGPGASATAEPYTQYTGHVGIWHRHLPVAKEVMLPPFSYGRWLADGLVQITGMPETVAPDGDGCFCFEPNDDRLAYPHTYYYAHQILSDYDALLRELRLPALHDVQINLTKDRTVPPMGTVAKRRRPPRIDLSFSSPAIDPFLLAQSLAKLVDRQISPRFKKGSLAHIETLRGEAEEEGADVAVADILAALTLGQTSSEPFTSDVLDAAPIDDVDTFVRFPDLVVTRQQVFQSLIAAPSFASRYPSLVTRMQRTLVDPAMRDYLSQPDATGTAAAITQPLWQAAVRFGFKPARLLVLRAVAHWSEPEITYQALARALVAEAEAIGPRWAEYLSSEYQRRGLAVQDAHLSLWQR